MSAPAKQLMAAPRKVGSRRARRARRDGFVTAVLYGRGQEPVQLQVPHEDLRRVLAHEGRGGIFQITIAGEEQPRMAVLKELQTDFNHNLIHADFQQVQMDQPVRMVIPIIFLGGEQPERKGWIVEHQISEIEISARPADLPERLYVDVSHLQPGQMLEVRDLPLPEGVTLHSDPHLVVAKCERRETPEPKTQVPAPEVPLEDRSAKTAP